jgi:hypothetical protein
MPGSLPVSVPWLHSYSNPSRFTPRRPPPAAATFLHIFSGEWESRQSPATNTRWVKKGIQNLRVFKVTKSFAHATTMHAYNIDSRSEIVAQGESQHDIQFPILVQGAWVPNAA